MPTQGEGGSLGEEGLSAVMTNVRWQSLALAIFQA
jgi:hypothetical protein